MSKSEAVLLAVPQVKYKKTEGTLYIMKERVAFFDGRDTQLIGHSFYDVKSELNFLGNQLFGL